MSAKVRVASFVVALGLLLVGSARGQDAGAIVDWGEQVVVPPSALTHVVAVTAGTAHSLGLKANGSLVAWGSNYDWNGNYVGQCDVPAPNSGFVSVAGGYSHSLGLKAFYGDLNCDGALNFDDINPFVSTLGADPLAWSLAHPRCHWLNADCNGDGVVNFDDIDAFVALLSGD